MIEAMDVGPCPTSLPLSPSLARWLVLSVPCSLCLCVLLLALPRVRCACVLLTRAKKRVALREASPRLAGWREERGTNMMMMRINSETTTTEIAETPTTIKILSHITYRHSPASRALRRGRRRRSLRSGWTSHPSFRRITWNSFISPLLHLGHRFTSSLCSVHIGANELSSLCVTISS